MNYPQEWRDICFALTPIKGAQVLLPPTVRIASAVGDAQSGSWQRAPFSSRWFFVGDALPREPPKVELEGFWMYDSIDEALLHTEAITKAAQDAELLSWRGSPWSDLRGARVSYSYTTGAWFGEVTHRLSLYNVMPPPPPPSVDTWLPPPLPAPLI